MPIIVLIAVLVSGGASLVAENALPGDALYPVKISVNEGVRGMVAVTDASQARWDAQRVERRLAETAELAAEGKLDSDVHAELISQFDMHANAFDRHVESVEADQDQQTAFELHSEFEATLKAHERLLTNLASQEESARATIEAVLVEVRARLASEARARADSEIAIAENTEANADFKKAAEGKLNAAEHKLIEARAFLEQKEATVNASLFALAQGELQFAEMIIARGKTEFANENYARAFLSFQEALSSVEEAKLLIATDEKIKVKLDVLDAHLNVSEENETSTETEMDVSDETQPSEDSLEAQSGTDVKIDTDQTEVQQNLRLDLEL